MRLNKFLALATGISRRAADEAIARGRVQVNGQPATTGQIISESDTVTLDGKPISAPTKLQTIMLNKPAGYVCSRDGQGSKTIYDLLPPELHHLKPVGRLDKDSSGLLLLTNDGQLAHQLTHPSFQKEKVYEVMLDKPLSEAHRQAIEKGVNLEDGPSKLQLKPLSKEGTAWQAALHEGRNRQVRRTFAALGYKVQKLHRTKFGSFKIDILENKLYKNI